MTNSSQLFQSFIQGGFESSTHWACPGRRVDLIAWTKHDVHAREDYQRLRGYGIRTVREAARWHLIEARPGEYEFGSLEILLDAAMQSETEVLLDLLHFGWPSHVDVFEASFPDRFSRFTRAVTTFIRERSYNVRFFAPVNEISFLSWAGGDVAAVNPFANGRGPELKRNLVRAAIAASRVVLNEINDARLIAPEPVIHIVGDPAIPGDVEDAERHRKAQFEAWDMLCGRKDPELGGRSEYLDIVGVNFYDRNEWVNYSTTLTPQDARYKPFRFMLQEVWERYKRPLFVAETGTEDDGRPDWFRYVCGEVIAAHRMSIPVQGVCLYPILNHPGWSDDRHCHNGLFDYADESGERPIYEPLADEIVSQRAKLKQSYQLLYDPFQHRFDLPFPPAVGVRVPTAPTLDEPVCQ